MIDVKEILAEAIEKYGDSSQLLKAVEELMELGKEITQYVNTQNFGFIPINRAAVLEELADVIITLETVKLVLNISEEEIELIKLKKLASLKEFLDTGENYKYKNRRKFNE